MKVIFLVLLMAKDSFARPGPVVETQRPWLADYIYNQENEAWPEEVEGN